MISEEKRVHLPRQEYWGEMAQSPSDSILLNVQQLPNEVLWTIFIYTGLITRKQIACVCRRWREVLPNWWNYSFAAEDLIVFTKLPPHQVSILNECVRDEQKKRETSSEELKNHQQQILLQYLISVENDRNFDRINENDDSDPGGTSQNSSNSTEEDLKFLELLAKHWSLLVMLSQDVIQELKILNIVHSCVIMSSEDVSTHQKLRQASYIQKIQLDMLLSEMLYYFPSLIMTNLSPEDCNDMVDSTGTRLTRWDDLF